METTEALRIRVRFVARASVLAPDDTLLEVRVRAVNAGRAIRTVEFGNC